MEEWRPIAPVHELDESSHAPSWRTRVGEIVSFARDSVRWFGLRRIATALVGVPLLGVGVYLMVRTPSPPVESGIEYVTTLAAVQGSPEASSGTVDTVAVHVAGHVSSPGVYTLVKGQRIVDAIRAAGGAQQIADLNSINLAHVLGDGDQVYVPAIGEVSSGSAAGRVGMGSSNETGGYPININSATQAELDTLPGIGPSTAAAIVDHRERFGPFATASDLLEVPGIGSAKLEAISSLVTT